jgi:hypothetical protein
MRTSRSILCSVAWFLLVAGQSEAQQIYKWVDEKGTVHFSQSPPPGGAGSAPVEAIPAAPAAPMVQGGSKTSAHDNAEAVDRRRQPRAAAVGDKGGEDEYLPEEDEDPGGVTVQDGRPDPRVWLRSRLPANKPGQPIRQPGTGAVPPRPVPRAGGRR